MEEVKARSKSGMEEEVMQPEMPAKVRERLTRTQAAVFMAMTYAVANAGAAGGDGTSGAFLGPVSTFLCSVAQFFSGPFALLTAVATVPAVLIGAGAGMFRGSAALKVIFYCLVALMSVSLIASALNAFGVDFTAGTNCTIQNLDVAGGAGGG